MVNPVWSNENPEGPNLDEHEEGCKCFNCDVNMERRCECGNILINKEGDEENEFCPDCI